MTVKTDILAEQILQIAKSLPTNVVNDIVDKLSKSNSEKELKVIDAIDEDDVCELDEAATILNNVQYGYIDVTVQLEICVANKGYTPEMEVFVSKVNDRNFPIYDNLIDEEFLYMLPLTKELMAKKQEEYKQFKEKLDYIKEKYKADEDIILEHCL